MTSSSNASDRLRAILVLVSTIGTIVFNGLASTGKLNGVMTDEVSNRYPTVLTPAGFTFTIWAAIYVGLIGFSIYQLLPSKLGKSRPIRTLYIATCVLNCAWLWAWHQYQIGLCLALIAGLLGVLFLINLRVRVDEAFADALFGKGVFGLYFGWVTAATLVNFLIFLVYLGVEMSPIAWNIVGSLVLVVAGAFAVIVRLKLRNFLYPLAIAWVATGIGVKQSGNTIIVLVAALCLMLCLVMSISFVMDKESTRS
ncbi:MAG: TspO/MBR family protein [Pyrinomonadaceae bacterium]